MSKLTGKDALLTPVQFFTEHAGVSWDPAVETQAQGRDRGARRLAAAEAHAQRCDMRFEWDIDTDIDSSEWSDETPPWHTWNCLMCDPRDGKVLASLHGIDFGRDGEPWGDSYKRVVEAELAWEFFL
jgi:hypothetical protein